MISMQFGQKNLKTERKAFVMGILNVTPDSFYEKSRGGYEKAEKLIKSGADILDIGGESTRPGFTKISVDEELNRVIPVIEKIRKNYDIPISIDTTKYQVLKAAFEAGADIYNDVSAFKSENGELSADFVAENNMSVVLMHSFYPFDEINEKNRNQNPNQNIVDEVNLFFKERIDFALEKKIKPEKIILDPGIGFGKSFEENILLIKNTDKLCTEKYPLLMALSRKRCIGTITGRQTEERLSGTLAANVISVLKGASILRVHDVSETIDALNIMKYVL